MCHPFLHFEGLVAIIWVKSSADIQLTKIHNIMSMIGGVASEAIVKTSCSFEK
jgi:hypothetical protein